MAQRKNAVRGALESTLRRDAYMHGIIAPNKAQQEHLEDDADDGGDEEAGDKVATGVQGPGMRSQPPPDPTIETYHKWLNHSTEEWP